MSDNSKDTNPKDAVGTKKVPLSVISMPVLGEIGLAMLEGSRKYGRHNYREAGVRASVYFDAMYRHMGAFWEGEDNDPDSGLSHVTKAIAGLIVLRDSMIRGNWVDDRPPKVQDGWVQNLNKKAGDIIDKYPDTVEPYTELNSEVVITNDNIDVTTDSGNSHTNAGDFKDIIKIGDLVKLVKTGLIGWESQDWAQQLGYNKSYEVDGVNSSCDFPFIRVKFDDYSTSFDFHPDHVEKIN